MTLLTDKDRLKAALAIARSLHESVERAESLPSGTSITPVGTEDGVLYVAIKKPDEATSEKMERIPCVSHSV